MEVQNISIGAISPSPINPRKRPAQSDIDSLAQNIRQVGLLQPITVRPSEWRDFLDDDGRVFSEPVAYEIVYGERRYRACRQLWHQDQSLFPTVPAIVRDMTDDEAFDAMVAENLQRKDIDPFDEAYAFKQLAQKSSVDDIAARFGKSPRYVRDRIRLDSLIEPLRQCVSEGRFALGAAILAAKLEPEDQLRLADRCEHFPYVTAERARDVVSSIMRRLASAPWAADPDFACKCCPVPCSQCRHNSDNIGSLFYELSESGDDAHCMRNDLYDGKRLAWGFKLLSDGGFAKLPSELGPKRLLIDMGPSYCTSKQLYDSMLAKAGEMGLMVAQPGQYERLCSTIPSEQARAMAERGEAVFAHALSDNICLSAPLLYGLGGGKEEDAPDDRAAQARRLSNRIDAIDKTRYDIVGKRMAEAYGKRDVGSGELVVSEEAALHTLMLMQSSNDFKDSLGISSVADEQQHDYVLAHPDMWPAIRREWLRLKLDDSCRYGYSQSALAAARMIGRDFEPEQYGALMDKARDKADSDISKLSEQLLQMGYGSDGEPIEFREVQSPAGD